MNQPALSTARLALRPAAPADADALWAIWRDPEVRRFLFDDEPVSRDRAAARIGDSVAVAGDGLGLWTLREAADPAVIGCAGLMPATAIAAYTPDRAGEVEVVIALAPDRWKRGYAQEALRALIAHAFDTLGRTRLAAVTDLPNAASDRLVRRVGFEPTGEGAGPRHRLRIYALRRAGGAGARP